MMCFCGKNSWFPVQIQVKACESLVTKVPSFSYGKLNSRARNRCFLLTIWFPSQGMLVFNMKNRQAFRPKGVSEPGHRYYRSSVPSVLYSEQYLYSQVIIFRNVLFRAGMVCIFPACEISVLAKLYLAGARS